MNSSSTDQLAAALPVLGLDVAKATVQAELQTNGNKMRFVFSNNAKGFAQLARILKECKVAKVWAGLEASGPTAMRWRCGSMARNIGSVY
jgi:transposase